MQAVTAVLLAAVAAVLGVRTIRLTQPPAPLDAHNERRFYEWAFGDRGLALHQALAGKEGLLPDGEVVCFEADVSLPGERPRWDSVIGAYLLPRQIVLVPAVSGAKPADPLPCRTRIVVPPDRTLRIERRPPFDRRS